MKVAFYATENQTYRYHRLKFSCGTRDVATFNRLHGSYMVRYLIVVMQSVC